MLSSDFIAFHERCKRKFGDIFRQGARVKPFPHDVYGWKAVAIDREGNVMVFSGDHGSSNPEGIVGVLNGKVFHTHHSNGRFQSGVRTISESRDTYPEICGFSSPTEMDEVKCINLSQCEMAMEMLSALVPEQVAKNEAEDKAVTELREFCKSIFNVRGFLTNLKRKHKNLIDWFAKLENKENSTWNSSTPLWCGSYRGWHSNIENVYFGSNKGAQGYKFICSANKADGTEVTEKTFYKKLLPSLAERAETLKDLDKWHTFIDFCMCRYGDFSITRDPSGAVHYYIKGYCDTAIPKDYKYSGAAWRDGLRKATETEEKTITKWVKVCGNCKLDTAMVNWSKRVWREPTEEELNALP